MAVRDRHHVPSFPVDLAVQKPLDERGASVGVAGLAVEIELHDVVGRHQGRRTRSRHQEPIGVARMTHRDVASRIEHALVREDPTRGREIFCDYFHGITDTWIAPGAPSPPTDLIA